MRTTFCLSLRSRNQSPSSVCNTNTLTSTCWPLTEILSLSLKSRVTVSDACCAGISIPNCCGEKVQVTACDLELQPEARYLHNRISRCRKKLSSRIAVEGGSRWGTLYAFSFGPAPALTFSVRNSSFGSTVSPDFDGCIWSHE